MARIGINDGHTISGVGSGAVGIKNESQETRRIGNELRRILEEAGHTVINCTVDYASTVNESLRLVTEQANREGLDIFIAIHLNKFDGTAHGVEVYTYKGRQFEDALEVCQNISALGFTNRGVKNGTGLYVINKTKAKAMLIEVCFCDNQGDVDLYDSHGVTKIAEAIAKAIDDKIDVEYGKPLEPTVETSMYKVGQHVTFSSCFISSANASTCDPALTVKCSVNHGVISEIKIVNGVTVYNLSGICWVNNGDIRELYNEPSKPVDNWVSRLDEECKKQGFNDYPTVKKGAKGNITKLIQERLNSVGFNLNVDGAFGSDTEYAVKVFQRNRNLSDDGVVGANTWRYLISGESY